MRFRSRIQGLGLTAEGLQGPVVTVPCVKVMGAELASSRVRVGFQKAFWICAGCLDSQRPRQSDTSSPPRLP